MRTCLAGLLFAVLQIPLALGTTAGGNPSADRIEEDWELVVSSPDPSLNGPQITMTMKPAPVDSAAFMLFNLNFRDYPSFNGGGIQAQIWNGGEIVASASQGTALLQTENETITWTQRMSLSGGTLKYKIASGKSTTWGDFGQADSDLAVAAASTLDSLADYDPDASTSNSGVSFQSNRVTKLTLVRVRYYQGDTLLSTDSTPRPVDLTD